MTKLDGIAVENDDWSSQRFLARERSRQRNKRNEGEGQCQESKHDQSISDRPAVHRTARIGFEDVPGHHRRLALFTGQRRSDVAAMTWTDVDPLRKTVRVVQEKTGTKLTIPIHRDLWSTLGSHPRDKVALLATTRGGPFMTESFGNLMSNAIRAAGLPSTCKLHGLRKSAGVRLSEVGCSTREIMTVLGHRSMSQAEHYTKHVNQAKLARTAIDRLEASA